MRAMNNDHPYLFQNGEAIPIYNFDHAFENMLKAGEEDMASAIAMHNFVVNNCEEDHPFYKLKIHGQAFYTLVCERIVKLGLKELATKIAWYYKQISHNWEFTKLEEATGVIAPFPSLN